MKNEKAISKLTAELAEKVPSGRICGRKTDLVIEGYPRSGNTFTVDMIRILQKTPPRIKLAHHSHSASNVRLGILLEKPVLIPLRQPIDAIVSLSIFSGRPLDTCAARYARFHRWVERHKKSVIIASFETITNDFNRVIDRLNALPGIAIPRSTDLEADAKLALEAARARSVKTHGSKAEDRVSAPSAARTETKAQLIAEAEEVLEKRPEIRALYSSLMSNAL